MQSVVLHVDGAGEIWAIAKCRVCGEVHKYLATEAIATGVGCRSCKHPMELSGATIAAASAERTQKSNGDSGKPDTHSPGSE